MRKLLAASLLFGVSAAAAADDPKPAPAKKPEAGKKDAAPAKKEAPAVTLKAGDPAPALKATKWLQGAEVREFAPGKVYVVEFWATWCGPCVVMMPHLAELQARYRGQGVEVIGYTAKDPNNSADKVAAFVGRRGPKLGYTFAYADDRDTYDAWMKAAGQNGIPCSFVVDPKGRLAYIGHPMFLDEVLPKVVAGSWKADEGAAELKKAEEDVNGVFRALGGGDADAGLKALADFEARRPGLAHIPYFVGPKLQLLLKAKKPDEAKKAAAAVVARATEQEDPAALRSVAGALQSPDAKGDKDLAALTIQAAEGALKFTGDKDAFALLGVAQAHFAAGDKARAKEFGRKAVDAAAGESPPRLKEYIEGRVKQFDEEKKDDKK